MTTRSIPRALVIALALVVILASALFALHANRAAKAAAPKAASPAVPVSVATVEQRNVPFRLAAIGNVEADTSVAVRARIDGQITAVRFREGQEVKQGQVLFELDPRPAQAALAQAQANLAKDRALLDRAQVQEKRYQGLLAQNFISREGYEQMRTNMATAAATVQADEAGVQSARLQVDYCTIRAPISGEAGKILIQQGNLVRANDTNALVTINKIVPAYVSFTLPEQVLAEVRKHLREGDMHVDAKVAQTDSGAVAGKVTFIDNTADVTTGTIRLKAEFANANKALWPGQFVEVSLTLYDQPNAIVVPSNAVQNGPDGQYVFVVKADRSVELRNVKVARAVGNDTVVAEGVTPGETVVTAGQLRLAPGSKVAIDGGKAA